MAKKFLDMDGVKALKTGLQGEVTRRTSGLLLPFDCIESNAGATVSTAMPVAGNYRVAWVPELKAFRAISGGGRTLVSYPAGARPQFTVESIDHLGDEYGDGPLPYPTEELKATDASMDSGLMATAQLDLWAELLPSKVVRRDTGAEVDFKALGLRIYGTWEDSRMSGAGHTARWCNVVFTDREITLEEFERVADWHTWYSGTFKHNSSLYDIPAGATVTILNHWGEAPRYIHTKWEGSTVYADTNVLLSAALLNKQNAMIYNYTLQEELEEREGIGVTPGDLDRLMPGYQYGLDMLQRWESLGRDQYKGRSIAGNIDSRLATEMPERFPSHDLSACTEVSNYPPGFTYSTLFPSPVREIAPVDVGKVESLSYFGTDGVVSLPRLRMPMLHTAESAFAGDKSLTTLSILGDEAVTSGKAYALKHLTTVRGMFEQCHSLIAIPYFEAVALTNLNLFANQCHSLLAAPWLETANVTNMQGAFANCYSMASVPAYDTKKVTTFRIAFYYCKSLRSLPGLDFRSATTVYSMCRLCYTLEHAGDINTGVCTDFTGMFHDCRNLRRVESIDLSAATVTTNIFYGCSKLDYLVITKLPKNVCTLDLSGLTAWGTTEVGKQSMEACIDALTERIMRQPGVLTLKIPSDTYGRWEGQIPQLDEYMADANITVVKV